MNVSDLSIFNCNTYPEVFWLSYFMLEMVDGWLLIFVQNFQLWSISLYSHNVLTSVI